jgi:hypothetical protein
MSIKDRNVKNTPKRKPRVDEVKVWECHHTSMQVEPAYYSLSNILFDNGKEGRERFEYKQRLDHLVHLLLWTGTVLSQMYTSTGFVCRMVLHLDVVR